MSDPEAALTETKATYDALADDMVEWQWGTDFGQYLDPFISHITKEALPVLDAGCGTGRDLWALINNGVPCIGVDISLGMLKTASNRVVDEKAAWICADLRRLPFNEGAVAGVWTNSALLHLNPMGMFRAIKEFRRVSLSGSPLFISTLAGQGQTVREASNGMRRWFWGTNESTITRFLRCADFHVLRAATEPGLVRGLWVNVLAIAK